VIDVQTATVDRQKTKIVSADDLLDAVEPLTLELMGEEVAASTPSGRASSAKTSVKTSQATDCGCEIQAEDAVSNLTWSNIERAATKKYKEKTGKWALRITDLPLSETIDSFCPEGGWRAPTFAELECMYRNRDMIGGFGNGGYYVSSKRNNMGFSLCIDFDSGKEKTLNRITRKSASLRCVRSR
jgi:hypothetical protein